MSDKQFLALCRVLDAPQLADDPALATNSARVAVRPELVRRLAEILRHHRVDELCPKLEQAGLPYAHIVRPDQLVDDPHLKQSGGIAPMRTDDGDVTQTVLLPLLLGGRRLGVRRPLPRAGEHTDEVLGRSRARKG